MAVFLYTMIQNIFFIILLLALLIGCADNKDIDDYKPYEGPVMEVENVETLFSDSAVVRIKLLADKQWEYENGNREFPEGVYIEFYENDGEVSSTISANQGYYYKKEDKYKASGNVIVKNTLKNEELRTEELFWEPTKQEISTDKYVEIETEYDIFMGNGLTAKQDFSDWRILQPTGTITIEEQP